MMDWADFCAQLKFGEFVPDGYAKYRPAVLEAAAFFLDQLPEDRVADILIDQAALPADADPSERLIVVAHHCPVMHKLGQVLARDRRLSPALRRQLQRLETMRPRDGAGWVAETLRSELGSLGALGVTLAVAPLAEASVSVVHRFRVGEGADARDGVFKILKPGIERKMAEELEILTQMGALLDSECHRLRVPSIRYKETFQQVGDLLRREVLLDGEQRNLAEARRAYAAAKSIIVPEVFPFSTPRVTAMEFVPGCKVTDAQDLGQSERRRLAEMILEAVVAIPAWSEQLLAIFHADPHAGNMVLAPDGRLALLDWSLTGTLTKNDRLCLSQSVLGAITYDHGRIAEAVEGLAEGDVDHSKLSTVVARAVKALEDGQWPSLEWLTRLLDDAAAAASAAFRGDLVIFRKALHTVNGVVRDVSEGVQPDMALIATFAQRLGREWPLRIAAPPTSRAFATHFSNADLTHVILSAPLIALRRLFEAQSRRS